MVMVVSLVALWRLTVALEGGDDHTKAGFKGGVVWAHGGSVGAFDREEGTTNGG